MATGGERFFALLIGITEYAYAPPLEGCLHDVAQARAFLDDLGVPASQIRTLTNADATRDGIIDAIRCHLIDNDAIGAGDEVLLMFSGHGAQMVDPLERSPSGYVESLVAHDSGSGGAFGIPDTTVGALLAQIARRGPGITVVLDCCHSGSGTRATRPGRARLTMPDPRPVPLDLDAEIRAAAPPMGAVEPYTLLAACRDRELAVEHIEEVDGIGIARGLFSWWLFRTLAEAPPGLSYAELMERVGRQVTAAAHHQHPQCEGQRDRVVFGGVDVRRDAFVRVTEATRRGVVLAAGSVAGLTCDTRLVVYPPETRRRDALPAALGEVVVRTSRLLTAEAVVAEDGPTVDPRALVGGRALVVAAGALPWVGRVAFEGVDAIEAASGLWQAAGPDDAPDVRVVARAGGEALVEASSGEVIAAYEAGRRAWLRADLDTVMRRARLERLRNLDARSAIQGTLSLRVRRHDEAERDPGAMARVPSQGGEVVLPYIAGDRALYGIEVVNDGRERVFATLLSLNADYGVVLLSPLTTGEVAIDPGRSTFVGHRAPKERVSARLPEGWAIARNSVLLVATLAPTSLDMLAQKGIDWDPQSRRGAMRDASQLAKLIEAFSRGKRALRRRDERGWGTARLAVTVMRRPEAVTVQGGGVELTTGVRAEAGGFEGRVVAAGFERMTYFHGMPAPPLAALVGQGWVAVAAQMRGERDGVVLRVDGVGPLTVAVEGGGVVAAVGFDAARWRMVGQGTGGGVTIEPGARWVLLARPAADA